MQAIITSHEAVIAGVRINFQNEGKRHFENTKDATKLVTKLPGGNVTGRYARLSK